jgi:hypothetical protein
MPLPLVAFFVLLSGAVQFFALGAAVRLATIFPDPGAGGVRATIRRINPFVTIAFVVLGVYAVVSISVFELGLPEPFKTIGSFLWLYYLIAITTAFWIANRHAAPEDKTRVRWVSLSLALGFAGPIVFIIFYILANVREDWLPYLQLTLMAVPFGLGYAIVRHRVVDIGFVVNRALVFGSVSAIVVVAFMALEWALSNLFVRVSHITSTSLELGLALVLGFSLRTIHARVDAVVDDVFFRDRHEAERALTTFAKEVGFIVDPRIAIARAHAELTVRTGAAGTAIYVVDGHAALRVDPAETPAPDRVDLDDPALVRMRADRTPCELRRVDSALQGDHAFPMCVRDAVSGFVVLAAKSNGEAFAPDELATIERVAFALGNALDALQTAALKAEVARVLLDGSPVEALRRTVDAAAWVRGVTPQPAGSLLGLRE